MAASLNIVCQKDHDYNICIQSLAYTSIIPAQVKYISQK